MGIFEGIIDGITCARGCAAYSSGMRKVVNVLMLAGLIACCAVMAAAVPLIVTGLVLMCTGVWGAGAFLICAVLGVVAFEVCFYLGLVLSSAAESRTLSIPYEAYLSLMEKRGIDRAGTGAHVETGIPDLPEPEDANLPDDGEDWDSPAEPGQPDWDSLLRSDGAEGDNTGEGRVWSFPDPGGSPDADSFEDAPEGGDADDEEKLKRLERKIEILKELIELEKKDR